MCLLLLLSAGAALATPEMRIHLIDVGQGASTLVELPCGAMLVDAGGEAAEDGSFDSTDRLVAYLDAFFARRTDLDGLDVLVVTHPHIDHVRGVPEVLARFHPRAVVDNGLPGKVELATAAVARLHEYAALSTVRHKDVDTASMPASGRPYTSTILDPFRSCEGVNPGVSALWGWVPEDPGWGLGYGDTPKHANENNHSVVVRVEFGEASLLVTGDLEEAGIGSLLQARPARWLDADVYQVGHHGSANGTTEALLDAITPEIALLAVGPADRQADWTAWAHGHPRQPVIDLLRAKVSGVREPIEVPVGTGRRTFTAPQRVEQAIYATGWDGTVVLVADAAGTFTRGTPDWTPPPAPPAPPALEAPAASEPLRITFGDVQEGDAILVQLGALDLLVDAGAKNSGEYLDPLLAQVAGPLETFVLTHPHKDHHGGAPYVLAQLEVSRVVTNGEERGPPRDVLLGPEWRRFVTAVTAEGLSLSPAVRGVPLVDEGGLRIVPLWTGGNYPDTPDGADVNNDSVVLAVEYAGRRVLLTGDLEDDASADLVAAYCSTTDTVCPALASDVLKVPHHGSADVDPRLWSATAAPWAVISAGAGVRNSHYLPRRLTWDALRAVGATVYSTSAEGLAPVRLTIAPDGTMSWDVPPADPLYWDKPDGKFATVPLAPAGPAEAPSGPLPSAL